MAIILNGDTGISSIGTLTGVTSVSSASADTPVILQDSSSNSNTCRAWVNFNGTGTVAIRADFNVTSITDNGTGDYTVNFTTAMPDANYAVTASAKYNSSTNYHTVTLGDISGGSNPTTTTCRLMSMANTVNQDCDYVTAAFFR